MGNLQRSPFETTRFTPLINYAGYSYQGSIPEGHKPITPFKTVKNVKKILIVESNNYLSETLVDLITALGFEVVGATANSGEIINLVQEREPDLLLIDYDMAKQIDIGTIRAQFPELKIAASGFEVIDAFAEIAKSLGLDGFVSKYAPQKLLLQSLNTLLP